MLIQHGVGTKIFSSLKIKHYSKECVILICMYGYYLLYSPVICNLCLDIYEKMNVGNHNCYCAENKFNL